MRNLISKKKETYPIGEYFASYLERYDRLKDEGARYEDLLRYNNSIPLYNEQGQDTLWSTVFYPTTEQQEIHDALRRSYAILKSHGDFSIAEQFYIDRIDLCLYGNTLPFRIRIVNRLNDIHDYFYVKRIDANRAYGLELEHILSPNRIHYFIHERSIIEEHIVGVPADIFVREYMPEVSFDRVRLAKEFVKFNERCFIRLLGDMHAGNFVVDMSRDFEKWQYRLRPIDFDQQSHHWRMQVYMPQHYPQNSSFIKLGIACLTPEAVQQYQKEERALIANRIRVSHGRFQALMEVLSEDVISPDDNIVRLREQLVEHYQHRAFRRCQTMGEIVDASLSVLLDRNRPSTFPPSDWT